jgi:chromate transporter
MGPAASRSAPGPAEAEDGYSVPREPWSRLFLRFLRFGALAWGGPVAQIAMIRHELVDQERWISSAHFNRVLAVYQVLPGPEAHELCVYFGMRSRGRWGGVLAGLGFMLPGFVLMFVLSWAYVRYGLKTGALQAVFAAVQVAVAALIVRAVIRIGGHVVTDRWLWTIAILATGAQLAGAHFALILAIGGSVHLLAQRGYRAAALVVVALAIVAVIAWVAANGLSGFAALTGGSVARESIRVSSMSLPALFWSGLKAGLLTFGGAYTVIPFLQRDAVTHGAWMSNAQFLDGLALSGATGTEQGARVSSMSLPALFWSGLKAGLLTFGGAYTVIPFLQRDAVTRGAWMSNAQFLDGLALSGLLPAPLIIFSTFVGYLGGGPWGAVAMTLGIFLPAFSFTLVGHDALERWVHHSRIRLFLEGVTAGVVGLIAGTTLALLRVSLTSAGAVVLFAIVLAILFASKAKLVIPGVIAGAALWGWVASQF